MNARNYHNLRCPTSKVDVDSHHLSCREEARTGETLDDDALNVYILALGRTP